MPVILPETNSALGARGTAIPARLASLLIAAAVIAAALIFLAPAPREFPMDDAYIHFVYAKNLADTGHLYFSVSDEVGVASSSLLWVLLLAGGYKLGLSMFLVSKLLGIASLIVIGTGVFTLLDSIWPRWQSLTAALLLSLSGNMLWFSLNGMETSLFLALGVTALLLYRAGRQAWMGVVLGLMILTRPEGIILAVVLGVLELIIQRRLTRDLALGAALALLICAPWFLYLEWRTGDFLPTSASGKQFSVFAAFDYMLERYHLPGILRVFPGLVYCMAWVVYLLEFALGGISLPPPKLSIGASGGLAVDLSIWVFPVNMLTLWLMLQAGRRFFARARWRAWLSAPHTRIFIILFFWAAFHNLVYMFFLPLPGTASRYGAVNYILLWCAIVGGLGALNGRPRLQLAATIAVLFVGLCNTIYWNRVYDANIEHMTNVRIAAAEYVREAMPGDMCAAFDIGALRYYGGRPIVEIAGLIETQASQWVQGGRVDEYLLQHHVTCLILPGRAGYSSDGAYDLSDMLKFDESAVFDMELVQVFEIDRERWLLGYLPTANYQASVAIYRLHYK
ncbi:MAG: hypothetical protein HFACDABA_03002 [Anaerolineales bacterium]|nr:hypothetical protein [Anaerolineales bacterium]